MERGYTQEVAFLL